MREPLRRLAALGAVLLACSQGTSLAQAATRGAGSKATPTPAATTARATASPATTRPDPRVQQLATDGESVIDLAVQRGQLTHVVLPPGETFILPPATGQGARCDDETHTWCIVAQGRDLFIKAKSGARTNNLILVTERRRFAIELRAVERGGLMRLSLLSATPAAQPPAAQPSPPTPMTTPVAAPAPAPVPAPAPAPDPQRLLQERLSTAPIPRNARYSMAVGKASEDITPSMVFDDGRFTYLRFAGNRPLPVIFQTAPDGSEETVNVRMGEDDLLIADRVGRRFVLRLGQAVVVVVNDGFESEGRPPQDGTTVPGVTRSLTQVPAPPPSPRPAAAPSPARVQPVKSGTDAKTAGLQAGAPTALRPAAQPTAAPAAAHGAAHGAASAPVPAQVPAPASASVAAALSAAASAVQTGVAIAPQAAASAPAASTTTPAGTTP